MEKLQPEDLRDRLNVFDVDDLTLWDQNPNEADMGAIHASMEEFGDLLPILVTTDRHGRKLVVDGNHRVQVERQARRFDGKIAGVDITGLEWSDIKALAAGLAMNSTARAGRDDPTLMAAALIAIRNEDARLLEAMSITDDDIQALLEAAGAEEKAGNRFGGKDPDEVPETAPSICAPGDLWVLDGHRLLCADAADPTAIPAVLDGVATDMVWTDPPYGVAYVGKTKDSMTIDGDEPDEAKLAELLEAVFPVAAQATRPGGAWFVAAPAGPGFIVFGEILRRLGIWRQTLVWLKDVLVMGRSDYHYRHEAIFYGWRPGAAHTAPPDRRQDSVWEIPRPQRSTTHPTMKPVELVARALRHHTKQGNLVLDPFGGSGTTIIAAHQEGRLARAVEVDPHYCDVICTRFQTLTGIKPLREGEPVDFGG